jgi:hypothetical protein
MDFNYFCNDIATFANEYDSFLFVEQYDPGNDQMKLTGVPVYRSC